MSESIMQDVRELLDDLLNCGSWYSSALEIEKYSKDRNGQYWDGEVLKARIQDVRERINDV